MDERVKVSSPKVDFFFVDAPASFPAADLRFLAVPGVHEPLEWVFGRVGHGKGSWHAKGRPRQGFLKSKRCLWTPLFVQKSTPPRICYSETALALPPPFPVLHVLRRLQGDLGIARG